MGKTSEQMNVKFTMKQREIINSLIGTMGGTEAEVVRCVFISWISEKGIISELIKKKWVSKQE